MKRVVALVALLAAALGVAGLIQPGAPAERSARVLRVAYQADPSSFDPDNAFLLSGLDAMRVVYGGLVAYAPGTLTLVPDLAAAWSMSPDGLTYRFRLRDGVRFSNGTSLTAAAAAASLRRRRDGGFALAYFLAGVAAIETPDARTVVMRLKAPDPSFLAHLASPWGPKIVGPTALVRHAAADRGAAWLDTHSDGTGPYMLASVRPGQRITLARNPHFDGPAPYFDEIQIFVVPDISQQVLMLQDGELDAVLHGYPFDRLGMLPPGLAVNAYRDLGIEMAYVNRSRALRSPDLRAAMFAAMAPRHWLTEAFGRYATPAVSLYPEALRMPAVAPRATIGLAEARRIVAAHGPVKIAVGYSIAESALQQRPVDLLVASLRAIGIEAVSQPMSPAQMAGTRDRPEAAPDLWIAQNNPDAADPATLAEPFFGSGAPLNVFGYSDPVTDRMLARAARETDRGLRDQLYTAAERRVVGQGAFLPLAYVADVIVHRDDLAGIVNSPAYPWTLNYETLRRVTAR